MVQIQVMDHSLNSLAAEERPQERLARHGPRSLSNAELLALLIRKGTKGCDVLTLSNRLLKASGTLRGLLDFDVSDFTSLPGIGKIKAYQLLAQMELARRVLQPDEIAPRMDSPDAVFHRLSPDADGLAVEKFWVLSLNRKNRLIRANVVTSGTATASLVHPREVFRPAIRNAATAIICAHNHPSGDPSPSKADLRVTRQLKESANILQIDLLDHVIIGNPSLDPNGDGFYSFSEAGFLSS